ncbi:hypothetical protein V6N11_018524 [Hibiscus sabdariffa]|uniref:Retrotransposon gag domain-containing protein n=1 Tax=Hibiscus sabdariffa TaxID=183260 RepID=A0ABR2T7N0_9ROSI
MNTVHVRDQKHELTPPRDRYPCDNGYKEVTAFPPRDIVYDRDNQLIGLRDKPITQQDALPRSESQLRFLPRQDPLSLFEASPLSSCLDRTSKHLHRRTTSRGQGLPAQADGAIAPPIPQNNQQPPVRTVRDYLAEDLEGLNPVVTMPEFKAEHFELKPMMFNMLNTLGQFGGSPTENARQHLKSFLEICNSFKIHGVSNDVLKLKLFPYSLRDKAKAWLNNLQPGSVQSWTQLCRSFLLS